MIKVGSLVKVKKEYYDWYMRDIFNINDILLVLEEEKYYTGFLYKPGMDKFQDPEVVRNQTMYKLLFPKYKIFTWADYQLEEII